MIDMDRTIEDRAGRKISDIFAQDGELHFRALERALVQELAGHRNLVIAGGGGVVLDPNNISDFRRTGVVVCLKATPSTILKRVLHEFHRPLLEGADKAQNILDLLEVRRPLYDALPFQIDTSYLSPEATADRILEIYEEVRPEAG
jgi:shikimate kinase